MKQRKLPFHAVTLRVLALVFMLLDHMWATVVPGNLWLTCLGRLAFPIFAFMTAEGFHHTKNIKKYAGNGAVLIKDFRKLPCEACRGPI